MSDSRPLFPETLKGLPVPPITTIAGVLLIVGAVLWFALPKFFPKLKGGREHIKESLGFDPRNVAIDHLVELTAFANDTQNTDLLKCCHDAYRYLNPLPANPEKTAPKQQPKASPTQTQTQKAVQ